MKRPEKSRTTSITRRRRTLRLPGYDYAQAGAYFVTVCTQGRKCLFGEVVDGSMRLSSAGQLAAAVWNSMPEHFPDIEMDLFVVMPNHLHGIIILSEPAQLSGAGPPAAIGKIVGGFKSLFTVKFIENVKRQRLPKFDRRLWQRNYYEHIIRDERDLIRVRRYIDENPMRWELIKKIPNERNRKGTVCGSPRCRMPRL